ncbi:MAG: hypothetical protein ACRDJV_14915 [Actinomycetota bacterium]
MSLRTVTYSADSGLRDGNDGVFEGVWPEYNVHGDVMNEYWDSLYDEFPDYQFVLYDDESGEVVAEGHSIPCRWDGSAGGLPGGIDGLVVEGFEMKRGGGRADTLSALAVEIPPRHQARQLSTTMLEAMRDLAAQHGLTKLIAPVRPSWKDRYPLTPIDRYVQWTRDDGLPFDPWIRVHHRMGAEIVKPEPHSLIITGTVAEWELWTQMAFPETGDYVFPKGLAPVAIDVDGDKGTYWEPNVWIAHKVGPG